MSDQVKFKKISIDNFSKLKEFQAGTIYFINGPSNPTDYIFKGEIRVTNGQIWLATSGGISLYTNGIKKVEVSNGKLVLTEHSGNVNSVDLSSLDNVVNIPEDVFSLNSENTSDEIISAFGSVENFNYICDKLEQGATAITSMKFENSEETNYTNVNIAITGTGYNAIGRFLLLDDMYYTIGFSTNRYTRLFQQSPEGFSCEMQHIPTAAYHISTSGLENTSTSDQIMNRINFDELRSAVESGCIIVDDDDGQIYINNSSSANAISLAGSVKGSVMTTIDSISIPLIIITKNDAGEMGFGRGSHPVMHLYHELGSNRDGSISQKVLTDELNNKIEFTETSAPSTQDPSDAFATKRFVEEANEALLHKLILSCKFVLYDGLKFGYSSVINAENFDTSSVTDMYEMFDNCKSLTTLDLSNFDTSSVTNMGYMFCNCRALTTLDLSNFDTSSVANMGYMFYNCPTLTTLDLSNFDTSSVRDMRYMFASCQALTTLDLSNFDTSSVTSMNYIFASCPALTTLDLSNFDTSSVPNMHSMFYNCKSLTTLDLSNFDTSSVTNMNYMFYGCQALTNLDLSNFDTSSVTYMDYMFFGCQALTNLDLSNFDTSSVTNMYAMFSQCYALTTLKFGKLTQDVVLRNSSLLTNESILYMITNATPTTAITITLHADAYARAIADTEIQAALAAQPLITLIS